MVKPHSVIQVGELHVSQSIAGRLRRMTYNSHPDDQPSERWRRATDDAEVASVLPQFSFQDPVAVGMLFCNALGDPDSNFNALSRLATPESLPAFGDFKDAAAFLASVKDAGYGSNAERAVGDDGVAYFKILSGITENFQLLEEQIMAGAGVVTLVWREEFDEWRVHSIGVPLRPEDVPH
ncbi:hypothetical protein KIH31_01110 [Paenarthrobacter sp. DKR-5]|nr:hypothetical protein [Paenarthrobacter sp. DKR-5]